MHALTSLMVWARTAFIFHMTGFRVKGHIMFCEYSGIATRGHLSTAASSLYQAVFGVSKVQFVIYLTPIAVTSLHQPLLCYLIGWLLKRGCTVFFGPLFSYLCYRNCTLKNFQVFDLEIFNCAISIIYLFNLFFVSIESFIVI